MLRAGQAWNYGMETSHSEKSARLILNRALLCETAGCHSEIIGGDERRPRDWARRVHGWEGQWSPFSPLQGTADKNSVSIHNPYEGRLRNISLFLCSREPKEKVWNDRARCGRAWTMRIASAHLGLTFVHSQPYRKPESLPFIIALKITLSRRTWILNHFPFVSQRTGSPYACG